MNNNYENQLLDEYLLDRLDEAGRLKVEERAARDPEFATEMELRRAIVKGIELAGEENLRQKIARIDASLAKQGFFPAAESASELTVKGGWLKRRRFLWAAASIALLLSCGLWLLLRDKTEQTNAVVVAPPANIGADSAQPAHPTQTPPAGNSIPKPDKRLAALARAAYNATAPNFSNVRNPEAGTSALELAIQAYQNGDFRTALKLLDTISSNAPGYWQAAEIRAHALFRSGQIREATGLFRAIAESGQVPFSERAEWFLLVCYASDYPRQKADFKSLSAKILADRDHPYYTQTQDLAAKTVEENKPDSD